MAILPPVFRPRYFSASGLPLAGGKLYTYEAGTTTPLATYTDATEASSNTNPIILDANGECNLWLGGNAYKVVLTDSNDVTQWTQDNVNQGQINNAVSADLLENLGITFTPANSPTITVKTGAGNIPSISDPVRVGFRGGSLASGLVSLVNITSPLAMNISGDATLGHLDGVTAYVYVYLINNNGVAELAVSSTIYQENALVSTTAMSSTADSDSVIYSTVARTNVPIRLIARITSNQVDAGSWIAAPTEIQTGEEARRAQINTNQIADGAVTPAKRSALGQQISSSSGNFSTSSTTFVDVTNLTVSITTTGRPVWVGLQPDGDTSDNAGIGCTVASGTSIASFQLLRGVTVISRAYVAADGLFGFSPPGSFWLIDVPAAGTYTYKVQTKTDTGSSPTAKVLLSKLVAFEL